MDTNGTMPAKQKSLLRITHAQNDSRYVEMGKLLHLTQVPGSDGELEGMNMKKNGHPYSYPDTVIMSIAGIRAIHGPLPYRIVILLMIRKTHRDILTERFIQQAGPPNPVFRIFNQNTMHNYETPLKAFSARKATDAIRAKNPQWMETDTND